MGKPTSTKKTKAAARGTAAKSKAIARKTTSTSRATARSAASNAGKAARRASATASTTLKAQRGAATPDAYYAALPAERRPVMQALRKAIAKALPKGFEEAIGYGMPGWVVPLKTYPAGYHCAPGTPLPFLSMASQKGSISVYHMGLYADPALLKWFQGECAKRLPKKLDMGKSCLRFKRPEDVPVDLIADLCRRMTPAQWIALYESTFKRTGK